MVDVQIDPKRVEALGPAERIINTLTTMTDHLVHNRPGLVTRTANVVGVQWTPCTWKQEGEQKVVYSVQKVGRKTVRTRLGVLRDDHKVIEGTREVGEYRKPSDRNKLFPEIAAHLYRQVAEVFKMDNEFAARWASYAFVQDNRDLKVILAAFLLVQNRAGEPVVEDGEVLFHDDDFRAVGEAMFLIRGKGNAEMEPKLLLRVGDVLALPEIAEINRELGFGKSGRNPALGRYQKAVTRWLAYREQNPKMLEGLVKAGYANTVKALARRVHYKPSTPAFFEVLGWKQKANEHRKVAIGDEFAKAATWEGLTEQAICERILAEKVGYKRLVGLLPKGQEVTPAIMAACIEAGVLSNKDLIILTPTLEALGLLGVPAIKARWDSAIQKAEDQRAQNIARNVKSEVVREGLQDAADTAAAKVMETVTRGLRVYVFVDKSGSMEQSLERAKTYLTRFLGAFPLDRTHVAVFNTVGSEVVLKAAKAAAVEQAFRGHRAGGGTSYSSGVKALAKYKPGDEEDALFLFVGDSQGEQGHHLADTIRQTGINPVAFGFLNVVHGHNWGHQTVESGAAALSIPCFNITEDMFQSDDPYVVNRVFRDLIAATPVQKGAVAAKPRVTLVEQVLRTPLLKRPVWAEA